MHPDTLIIEQVNGAPLLFPSSYKDDQISSNGCGPEGFAYLVPDHVLGLSIFGVCRVHDHMCKRCANLTDEIITDGVFAFNLITTIVNKSKGVVITWLRLLTSVKYIVGVSGTTFTKSYWPNNAIECPKGRYLKC